MTIKFKIDPRYNDDQQSPKRNLQGFTEEKYVPRMRSNYSGDIPIKELLNSTTVDMYVEPAMNRQLDEDFNVSTVNFTWYSISFENDTWEIQLNFSDPHMISPEIVYDRIVVHIFENATKYFYSEKLNLHLNEDFYTLSAKIMRQMPLHHESARENSESAKKVLMVSFVMVVFIEYLRIFRYVSSILYYV